MIQWGVYSIPSLVERFATFGGGRTEVYNVHTCSIGDKPRNNAGHIT